MPQRTSPPPTIDDHTQLLALLHGPLRLVMVLMSLKGDPAATIAERFGSDPSTVWCWIQRFNHAGIAGLGNRPRSGRPRLGSPRLPTRIRRWLAEPWAWKGSPSEPVPMGCPTPGPAPSRPLLPWAVLAILGPAAGAYLGLHRQPNHALPQAAEPVGMGLEVFTDPVLGVHPGRGIVLPLGLDLEG